MRALLALPCLALACATAEPALVPTPLRVERVAPRPQPAFDARQFAAEQLTPLECETAARRLRATSADQGWEALKACVERSRWPRGEFTHLERLTAGAWDQDLQDRPDAPRLVARVIALRGGDVEGDLAMAQKSRVPLFSLAAALRQPEVYKGRWVLLRGSLSEIKQDAGKTAALVHETSMRATAHDVDIGPRYRTERESHSTAHGEVKTTHYGNASGSASTRSTDRTESSKVDRKFENERVETGRQAVGKLAQADPFLEPDKDFVFLGRFDGVRPGEDERPVALLSISGYFQPNALMIQ
jgi:hypothetical protein